MDSHVSRKSPSSASDLSLQSLPRLVFTVHHPLSQEDLRNRVSRKHVLYHTIFFSQAEFHSCSLDFGQGQLANLLDSGTSNLGSQDTRAANGKLLGHSGSVSALWAHRTLNTVTSASNWPFLELQWHVQRHCYLAVIQRRNLTLVPTVLGKWTDIRQAPLIHSTFSPSHHPFISNSLVGVFYY